MALENQKQIIIIAIAVVAGIGAVVLTSSYVTKSIQEKTQELSDKYEQQQKQVAAELQQRSDEQIRAVTDKLNQVQAQQQQAIQQAAAAMRAAEAQKEAKAGVGRSNTLLTAKTPAGKRAITVLVDSLSAVGGLINAGDFVDVIAHLDIPAPGAEKEDKKNTVTAMVFQDLEVLAINTNLDQPGDYSTQQNAASLKVTFAVDPQEAGLLAFASKKGKLELALRAKDENEKENVKTSTWKTLADYVLQNQGASFDVPEDGSTVKTESVDTTNKPYIQIFRAGKEL